MDRVRPPGIGIGSIVEGDDSMSRNRVRVAAGALFRSRPIGTTWTLAALQTGHKLDTADAAKT